MFDVYAVALEGDIKHRSFIASEVDLLEAKERARIVVQSFADYAYVIDKKSTIVFVVQASHYETQHNPLSQVIRFPLRKLERDRK